MGLVSLSNETKKKFDLCESSDAYLYVRGHYDFSYTTIVCKCCDTPIMCRVNDLGYLLEEMKDTNIKYKCPKCGAIESFRFNVDAIRLNNYLVYNNKLKSKNGSLSDNIRSC